MPDYPNGTFNELDSSIKANFKKGQLFNSSLSLNNIVESSRDMLSNFKNLSAAEVESL